MTKTAEYVEAMRSSIPEIEPLYLEHIEDNDQLLPHVFMGSIARHVEILFRDRSISRGDLQTLTGLLQYLEHGMLSPINEIQELVAVSFLENLDRDNPEFHLLKKQFGPALLSELEKQRGLYGSD